jgi:hypothetical protein
MSLHMMGAIEAKDAGPLISQAGDLASAIAKKATADENKKIVEADKTPKKTDDGSYFDWLGQNTIISAVPNYVPVGGGVVLGGGLLAYLVKKFLF